MKGHLVKRARGSWTLVVDVGHDATGRRRQKWLTVKGTKKQAQAELARIIHEIETGQYTEPSRLTLGQYLERWAAEHVERNLAPATVAGYRNNIKLIGRGLGHIPLSRLKPLHILTYYGKELERGLLPQSVGTQHTVLRAALAQAVKWQLITRNPVESVAAPRARETQRPILNAQHCAQILDVVGQRDRLAFLLAITTGMRLGEISALRWSDVNLDGGWLQVERTATETPDGAVVMKAPKSSSGRRRVALGPYVVQELRRHKAAQSEERLRVGPELWQDHDLVVPRPDGSPHRPRGLSKRYCAIVRQTLGSGHTFHDLRHAHASQLIAEGVNAKAISSRLGHGSIGITMNVYGHLLPGLDEDAAARTDAAIERAVSGQGGAGAEETVC